MILIVLSTIVRVIVWIRISFDIAFQSSHIAVIIALSLLVLILELLKNRSEVLKKFMIYATLEYLNVVLRYFSIYIHRGDSVLYCLTSTIFTILFQTSIFQNEYHVALIVIKHISL